VVSGCCKAAALSAGGARSNEGAAISSAGRTGTFRRLSCVFVWAEERKSKGLIATPTVGASMAHIRTRACRSRKLMIKRDLCHNLADAETPVFVLWRPAFVMKHSDPWGFEEEANAWLVPHSDFAGTLFWCIAETPVAWSRFLPGQAKVAKHRDKPNTQYRGKRRGLCALHTGWDSGE
jgi:hypothetical protein